MFGYSIAQERGFVKRFERIFEFFIFWEKGERGREWEGECKLGIFGWGEREKGEGERIEGFLGYVWEGMIY